MSSSEVALMIYFKAWEWVLEEGNVIETELTFAVEISDLF